MRTILTDRSIETGSSHLLCEDYALVGEVKPSDEYRVIYACVSDGCSSAPNADLRARFLCHNFATLVKTQISTPQNAQQLWPHLPGLLLQNHLVYTNMLGVSSDCMYATFWGIILFIPTDNTAGIDRYFVCGYGDGAFIETDINGKCYVYLKEYPSGAPYYPIYHIDPKRDKAYRNKFSDKVMFKKYEIDPETGECELIYSGEDSVSTPFVWVDGVKVHPVDVPSFSSMSLFSDGVHSFQGRELADMTDLDKLTWFCKNYMTFPVQTSNFMTRNCRFMASESRRTKTVHTDDLGCASIMLKYSEGE